MSRRKTTASAPTPTLLLTIPQVAASMGLGKSKVYDLINYEGLPYVKLGNIKRVPFDGLQQWIQQHTCNKIA